MKKKIQTKDAEGNQLFITIRLDDECKNGHADFAITGSLYEANKPCTDSNLISAGCIHDEILAARPDLKLFVDLHLSDAQGVPMYAVENGYYHLHTGFNSTPAESPEFKAKFCSYYRITPEQFDTLNACGSQIQYALAIQSLGILDQWKAQANEAIKLLEEMTGETFIDTSIKSQFHAPTPEQIADEKAKVESGYYTPEAKAQRQAAKVQAKIDSLKADRDKAIAQINNEYEIKVQVLALGGEIALKNCIVYPHRKQLAFNWMNYEKPLSSELVETIAGKIKLPEGFTIKPQAKAANE